MNELLSSRLPGDPVLAVLLDVSLKGTVVLAGAWLLSLALRRSSAAGRHLVWGLGMYALLALPALCLTLPSWRVPLLPELGAAPAAANSATSDLAAAAPIPLPVPAERAPVLPEKRPALADSAIRTTDGQSPADAGSPPSPAVAAREKSAPAPWSSWLLAGWLAGAALTLAPLLLGLAGLWLLARRAERITDPDWIDLADRVRREIGLNRRVTLLRCGPGAMPMTWGLVRPVVLLPAEAEDWPADRRRLVLLHELAHVRRRDCLSQLLAQLVCALYWFHPLVWLAARRLRVERERACDDQVLLAGSRASDYAYLLLETARALRAARCPAPAAVAMAQPGQLEGRLLAILDPHRRRGSLTRTKVGLALVGLAAVLVPLAAFQPWARAAEGKKDSRAPKTNRAGPASGKLLTISGRVVDPKGKPVPGAEVILACFPEHPEEMRDETRMHTELLGRATADGDGRFRLRTPPRPTLPAGMKALPGQLIAHARGYGFGLQDLAMNADRTGLVVRLKEKHVLRGRLIDLQGAGVAGVRVECLALGEKRGERYVGAVRPGKRVGLWPGPFVTDRDGRFTVRLGRGQGIMLSVRDDRYSPEMIELGLEKPLPEGTFTRALTPARAIEGRVTYQDTGKPVAGARLQFQHQEVRADRDGRYRVNPPLDRFHSFGGGSLFALPPEGQPYLGLVQSEFGVPRGKSFVKRRVDFALPRGIPVRGRVTEAGTGKPLSRAEVYFLGSQAVTADPTKKVLALGPVFAVRTKPDGRYAITVPAGPGRLIAKGYTPDYVPVVLGDGEIYRNEPGGGRFYAHAFVKVDFKAGSGPHEVKIELRRGVRVEGRVAGPEGQPASGVRMITRLSTSVPLYTDQSPSPVPVPDAGFRLNGCDPGKPFPVVFLDEKDRWGALVSISGKQAGKPLTVRLRPFGAAAARFVDGSGKPLEGYQPQVDLVLSPGPQRYDFQTIMKKKVLAADTVGLSNCYQRFHQWGTLRTDRQGRCTITDLVPGATYRIWRFQDSAVLRDFQVKPGETLDLGTITVKKP